MFLLLHDVGSEEIERMVGFDVHWFLSINSAIKAVFVAILLAAIFRTPVKQEQQEEEENEEKEREENAQKEVEDRIGNDGLVDADEVPIIR